MKKTSIIYLVALVAMTMVSCRQDELSSTSIFPDEPVLDPTAYNYETELYLYENYLIPYNIKLQYQLPDGSTDKDYNLVPVRYDKVPTVAHAIKYLWIDVYAKQLAQSPIKKDNTFIQRYAPRIINVLGSPAINAAQHTETLGVAEGGVKITLYNMNDISLTNMKWLNKYIFHVMHHEFSHILHQNKTFPKEYENISAGNYDSQSWQYKRDKDAYALGFVTPYSMSEAHEDFVEVISSYITDTREVWADRGFDFAADNTHITKVGNGNNKDGVNIINRKITMAKDWLREKYFFELDSIRAEVQRRQDYLHLHPSIEAMDAYEK